MDKIGKMLQKAKLIQDVAAAAEGSHVILEGQDFKVKAKHALRRYTGYNVDTGGINIDEAMPNYQGIATSLIENYIDSKTGHAAGLSRYAIADLIEEGIPILRAHLDASGTFHSTTNHFLFWTKYRTGYDSMSNTHDLGRAREYLLAKGARIVLRKSGVASWINRKLPKGLNI